MKSLGRVERRLRVADELRGRAPPELADGLPVSWAPREIDRTTVIEWWRRAMETPPAWLFLSVCAGSWHPQATRPDMSSTRWLLLAETTMLDAVWCNENHGKRICMRFAALMLRHRLEREKPCPHARQGSSRLFSDPGCWKAGRDQKSPATSLL